jgi:hypothetical protein
VAARFWFALAAAAGLAGCDSASRTPLAFTAVAFNTGTSEGVVPEGDPNGGYTREKAAYSDQYYGDGLAFVAVVEDAREFLAERRPELVFFQEIFYSGDCPAVPAEARPGFVCESWVEGQPTVAQRVVGEGYQVACHVGKPDKCLAVRRDFGVIRGCGEDFCLEGLYGTTIPDCGKGARIGRATIDLAGGGELVAVNVHASSGFSTEDQQCRVKQVEQIFLDLGDGQPALSGALNLAMGDFNTDPGRLANVDPSAQRINDFAGSDRAFRFISDVGPDALPSYAGLFNIDHAIGDRLAGSCASIGVAPGTAPVSDIAYFDHHPLVCQLREAP